MGLFKKSQDEKSYLGVDIGGSSIKLVELSKYKNRPRLLTYGYLERSTKSADESLLENPTAMAEAIKKVADQAKVQTKDAITALPASSVFSTILNLNGLTPKDVASVKKVTEAIEKEATKVLPMPVDEMVLDWKIVKQNGEGDNGNSVQVLLNAASKSLVKKFIEIFKKAGFNLLSLETESFAMSRALVGKDKSTVIVIDIGASNTDISIVDNMIPHMSRSVDVGGYTITKALAESMGISIDQAEQFKRDLEHYVGELPEGRKIPEVIEKIMEPIVNEIRYLLDFFGKQPGNEGKNVDRLILSGGTAKIFNLPDYFTEMFNIRTFLGSPWARIIYPDDLKPALDQVGSRLTVAVGLALRELDK
ncbi:TPA: hypothetical protein DF272_05900 [Candidatus Falkowbacteria bacterium]|nr:hypothetical protein [Candidatus Falkowbacteria bacterium]